MKAYRYENTDVPINGEYVINPKFRASVAFPQMLAIRLGLHEAGLDYHTRLQEKGTGHLQHCEDRSIRNADTNTRLNVREISDTIKPMQT